MGYSCKECGMAVIVLPDQPPIRACKCNGVIIADASSTMTIVNNIAQDNVRIQPDK